MEKLCESSWPTDPVLISGLRQRLRGRCDGRLESLGQFKLRGVDEGQRRFLGCGSPQTAALQRVEA